MVWENNLSSRTYLFVKEVFRVEKKNATRQFFLMPRVRLENLMRFSKIEKKNRSPNQFLKNWVSKGLFAALYHCHGNCWDIADNLKKLYANAFIQMTKHCSSDRDTSVVIFLHWTPTVSRGKPYRASLNANFWNDKKIYRPFCLGEMPCGRFLCTVQKISL